MVVQTGRLKRPWKDRSWAKWSLPDSYFLNFCSIPIKSISVLGQPSPFRWPRLQVHDTVFIIMKKDGVAIGRFWGVKRARGGVQLQSGSFPEIARNIEREPPKSSFHGKMLWIFL